MEVKVDMLNAQPPKDIGLEANAVVLPVAATTKSARQIAAVN